MPVDVVDMECDFLSATMRKFLRGPRGGGFLYVSDEALKQGFEPLMIDMRGARMTSPTSYVPVKDARRFESWDNFFFRIIPSHLWLFSPKPPTFSPLFYIPFFFLFISLMVLCFSVWWMLCRYCFYCLPKLSLLHFFLFRFVWYFCWNVDLIPDALNSLGIRVCVCVCVCVYVCVCVCVMSFIRLWSGQAYDSVCNIFLLLLTSVYG